MITKIPVISWEFQYILRILSLWPNAHNIFAGIILWLTWITILPFQFVYLYKILDNITELMSVICDFFTEIALFLKLFTAWINRKILLGLIAEMADDWQRAEIKITRETRLSLFITRLDLYIYCASIIVFFPKILIDYISNTPEEREFFFKTSYPSEVYKSPIYEIIVIIHFFQLILMTAADLMPQAFIFALVCHSGVQYNNLYEQVKEFIVIAQKGSDTHEWILWKGSELINNHQKNIDFAGKIEKAFSVIILVQCLCSVLTMGCCGIIFVVSTGFVSTGQIFIYLIMKLVQTFILCYAGEYLTNKSTDIANAVYESNWYNVNKKYMKILQLIILRAHKPSRLTAGKLFILSSRIFTVILKASVSYVSVLQAKY